MRKNNIFLQIPQNGCNTLHSILKRFYPPDKTFYINAKKNTSLILLPENQDNSVHAFGLSPYQQIIATGFVDGVVSIEKFNN